MAGIGEQHGPNVMHISIRGINISALTWYSAMYLALKMLHPTNPHTTNRTDSTQTRQNQDLVHYIFAITGNK